MKKLMVLLFFTFYFSLFVCVHAQCSVCTKTAQQMGEKPAKGLNNAILYLAAIPFCIAGVIGYRWYKSNSNS